MTDQPFKRLKGIRLSDQAVEQIQSLIMNGHFEPGSKLPSELELVNRFEISRASIREALRTLESRGVIQVKSGSGAYVSDQPFSFHGANEAIDWLLRHKNSLIQILEVREVLEGLAANRLASSITDETLLELQSNLEKRIDVAKQTNDADSLSKIDMEFHKIIAKACGNQVVNTFIDSIVTQISCSNLAIVFVSNECEIPTKEHSGILEALRDKDPERTEQLMKEHIARIRADVMNIQQAENL